MKPKLTNWEVLMSVLSAQVNVSAGSGTYHIEVYSVNRADQVNFQLAGQAYDYDRLEDSTFISECGGTPFPSSKDACITCHQVHGKRTERDQNPIKMVVQQITPDQGEYLGNSAVFYGYFLDDSGHELNFYLNQEQSQRDFKYGITGISTEIDQSIPCSIVCGKCDARHVTDTMKIIEDKGNVEELTNMQSGALQGYRKKDYKRPTVTLSQ